MYYFGKDITERPVQGRLRCSGPSQEIPAAGIKSTRGKKKMFCLGFIMEEILEGCSQNNTMIGE